MKKSLPLLCLLTAALAPQRPEAQTVYEQNFDLDDTANWIINTTTTAGGSNRADLYFNYSTVGIPSAPNAVGGTTRGLLMQANIYGGTAAAVPLGVSVSPAGKSFTGDYRVQYDMWANFNGPLGLGGSGSTHITSGGIGTAGTSAQVAGATIDSILFGVSGDGGSSADYRAYSPTAQGSYADTSGVYAAGNVAGVRNNTSAYYSGFGGASAPAAQLALFPGQTGTTAVGAQGFAWRNVVVEKVGTSVKWYIDGTILATVDATGMTFGGNNIVFSQFDINNTASADTNSIPLQFGLIDNIKVTLVPEPGSLALVGFGLGLAALLRRRK